MQFVLDLPPQAPFISVDANLWRRVLDNLVSNAIKFSPTNGVVTLRVSTEADSRLKMEVTDEGPGIPAELRETIFDKYKIISAGRRDVKQVGLGLAFCKMVVDAHNGRIFVTPNQPKGAIFTVIL
ncbi:MAG TPA: ATP-binding protein [Anaerolineae bacterium]|nr:ATP-binding protein [Anaerolineae bacterium]